MANHQQSSKAIHTTLWIAQVLLGAMFVMAGSMKATQPIDQLSQMMPWTGRLSEPMVRFIGISEFLGAVGLLLPALLRIKPILTPVAAAGLSIVQLLAIFYHILNGELSVIGMNVALLLMSAFIAWGRYKKAPIHSKS